MADPRHHVVLAVYEAFRGAIRDGDADAVQARCTEAGWIGRGDAAGRFARRAMRLGHVPGEAEAVVVRDGRAAVRFGDALGTERFALFEREGDGAWRIAAVPAHPVRSGLFLTGRVDAVATVRDLADSEEAAAWARAFTLAGASWTPRIWPSDPEAVAAVERLRRLAVRRGTRVDRLGAVEVPGDRAAVGLLFTRRGSDARDEVWVVLGRDPETGGLAVRHLAWVNDLDAFLADLPVGWDGEPTMASASGEVTDRDGETGFSAARLDRILAVAVDRLEAAGGGPASREVAEAVRRRFRDRLRRGGGPPDRDAAGAAPLAVDLGAVVREVAGDAAPEEVVVDRRFVAEHGRDLVRAAVGAFAKALVPTGPVAAEFGAGEGGRRVEVDVVDLVTALLPDGDAAASDGEG